uniref:Uncharacterized protein n=1 Tax=Arundo donax TaxID=35708 RepID=A0A0A9G9B4_ARUDO
MEPWTHRCSLLALAVVQISLHIDVDLLQALSASLFLSLVRICTAAYL